MELSHSKSIGNTIVYGITLFILNLALVSIFGFLTFDSWANINSRVGALILAFFLPFFIVYKTKNMSDLERLIKFGFGFFFYALAATIIGGLPHAFTSALLPSLTIAMGVLYYGGKLVSN